MNRTCVHQEEIQSEKKIHFYSLSTGAANLKETSFSPNPFNRC